MSRADVLRTIKDAEADAAATLAKAESEASNIVTKARVAAAETVSEGPWLEPLTATSSFDNFFETVVTEYNASGLEGDDWGW